MCTYTLPLAGRISSHFRQLVIGIRNVSHTLEYLKTYSPVSGIQWTRYGEVQWTALQEEVRHWGAGFEYLHHISGLCCFLCVRQKSDLCLLLLHSLAHHYGPEAKIKLVLPSVTVFYRNIRKWLIQRYFSLWFMNLKLFFGTYILLLQTAYTLCLFFFWRNLCLPTPSFGISL